MGIHFSVKRASRKHIFCGTGRKYSRLPTHTYVLCLQRSHIKTARDPTSEKKTEKAPHRKWKLLFKTPEAEWVQRVAVMKGTKEERGTGVIT